MNAKLKSAAAAEWKVVAVRETAATRILCDRPPVAAQYWRDHIATAPQFTPEVEWLAVLVLNAKYHLCGHYFVGMGSMNECLAHPREVMRTALVGGGFACVVMHNHPGGDPTPSDNDRRMTDKLKACADLLGITLLDHVIVGADDYFSFRERGMMGGNASAGRDDVAASALAASRGRGRSVTVTKSRGDSRRQLLRWRFQCLAAETLRNPGDECEQLAKVESIATVAAALGFKKEASAARGLADAFRNADNHAMKLSDLLELREWLGEENNLPARVVNTAAALAAGK